MAQIEKELKSPIAKIRSSLRRSGMFIASGYLRRSALRQECHVTLLAYLSNFALLGNKCLNIALLRSALLALDSPIYKHFTPAE